MVAVKRKAPARAARRLLSNQISEPVQRLVVRGEKAAREELPGANHKRALCFHEDLQRNRAPEAASYQRINRERVFRPGLSKPACDRFADTGKGIAHLLHAMADGAADLLCALRHLVTQPLRALSQLATGPFHTVGGLASDPFDAIARLVNQYGSLAAYAVNQCIGTLAH